MKKNLGIVNALYPMPTTLVGAMVNGKPNFITIAHVGVLTVGEPECISLGMHKSHHTNAGIKENQEFSVCIPPEGLMEETDYCGLVTGKNTDKAAIFEVFHGELKNAPLIQECPVCMECRLHSVVDMPQHDVFIGEIRATWADESVIAGGKLDLTKLRPLLFDMASKRYYGLGRDLGGCWNAGLAVKRRLKAE